MTTEQAIEYFGGRKQLAAALGIWPHNISRWGEYPPLPRQFEIEIKTDGALKIESDSTSRGIK